MPKYSYSTDEERYYGDYNSIEDATKNGFDDNLNDDIIYIGENIMNTAHSYINPLSILEQIIENAEEEVGECCEDWLGDIISNKNKLEEFKKLIGDWIEINYPVNFWTVKNVQQITRK